ncbi:MAG: hypothetical protein Fur0021_10110 [Candidatus Promineifilaceae bacterium]
MRRVTFPVLGLIVALMMPALACALPQIGGRGEPTPAPLPTPMGDTLTLTIPLYRIGLEPGDAVPGAELRYIGQNGGSYDVTIGGLPASKRSGDSFSWQGIVAPGVVGNYNLRLTATLLGRLVAAGQVTLNVFNPAPVAINAMPASDGALYYNNIAVQYLIPAGRAIPGTTLVFEGIIEPGGPENLAQRMAHLSGGSGYPYFALGDSVGWMGQLRDNVTIRYSLRVIALEESGLRVAGTAELWVK